MLLGAGTRSEYRITRVAFFTTGASAVMTYALVAKVRPGGFGHGLTGLMSTETEVLPATSKAPGKKSISTWASSVNAILASLTPPITLMSRWPEVCGWLARSEEHTSELQ